MNLPLPPRHWTYALTLAAATAAASVGRAQSASDGPAPKADPPAENVVEVNDPDGKAATVKKTVDAKVATKLADVKARAGQEDRTAVIRRLYLDVAGRPPTQEEADEFRRDKSPQAYERAVGRLLERPGKDKDKTKAAAAVDDEMRHAQSLLNRAALQLRQATEAKSDQQDAARKAVEAAEQRLADIAARSADEARRQADKARAEVSRQRGQADQQRAQAEQQRALAEQQRALAERKKAEATAASAKAWAKAQAGGQSAQSAKALSYLYAAGAGKQTRVAYLGVGVEPPSETLRAQLKLADGSGLVVNYVDESGPAKGAIRQHDVLQRLDEQILVNPEQLVTLVRMKKAGESLNLTVIRQARPVNVEVKLGERDVQVGQAEAADLNVNQFVAGSADASAQAVNADHYTLVRNVNQAADTAASGDTLNYKVATDVDGKFAAIKTLRAGPLKVEDKDVTIVFPPAGQPGEMQVIDTPTGRLIYTGPRLKGEDDPAARSIPADVRSKVITWSDTLGSADAPPMNLRLDRWPGETKVVTSVLSAPATRPAADAASADAVRVEVRADKVEATKSESARDGAPPPTEADEKPAAADKAPADGPAELKK